MGLRRRDAHHEIHVGTPEGETAIQFLNWNLRGELKQRRDNLIWTSWQINVNSVAATHRDSNNVGRSFITVLGDHEGGISSYKAGRWT